MSLENVVLKLPRTESESDNGINDGNIETFKNYPMISLTKEELQNSTDNALNYDYESPVVVEFNEFYIGLEDLPDHDSLFNMFKNNQEYWSGYYKHNHKADDFFNNAINILNDNKIRCLRISDFNTTGLTEIESRSGSSSWKNLVIDRGVSDKKGDKGGSFGIGKDASYACSELRLVFYSTINVDNEKAFEGVCKLPSFKKDDINYVGWGFFCKDDGILNRQKPIRESISLDPGYTRKVNQYGMDKFIIGFDSRVINIEEELVISSINNFLHAFIEGRLVVKIKDIEISKETIGGLVDKYKNDKRLDIDTIELYETVSDPTDMRTISLYEENDVELVVKMKENYRSRVSMVRKTGIKVHNTSRGLVKNCSYSAAILLEGELVNTNFKKFENIEHNKWSLLKAPEHKDKYHEMIKELNNLIKDLNEKNYQESVDADGVKEFLPLNYIQGNQARKEALTNDVKFTPPIIRKINSPVVEDTDDIYEEINHPEKTRSKRKGRRTDKKPPRSSKKRVRNADYQIMMKYKEGSYDLLISPNRSLNSCELKMYISGETETKEVNIYKIVESNGFVKHSQNSIFLGSIDAGETRTTKFMIESNEIWNLEVKIYEG